MKKRVAIEVHKINAKSYLLVVGHDGDRYVDVAVIGYGRLCVVGSFALKRSYVGSIDGQSPFGVVDGNRAVMK